MLLTLAGTASWGFAHEGHDALLSKGATVKGDTVQLSAEARKALDLRVIPVGKRTLERTILAPATVVLKPRAHAFAGTLLAGRVERVLVEPGQAVRAGETLALVRSPQLEGLQTDVITARLELELADKKLKPAEDLSREFLGSPLDLLVARNRRQEKANALRVVELKLQALGVEDEKAEAWSVKPLPIRAPIAGVVAHMEISPGMAVEPQQHLLEIADPSQLRVRADVPEAYTRQIAVGNPARVTLRDRLQKPLPGVVRARQSRIDLKTLTEPIWIDLDESQNSLAPGMAGQSAIVVERRENVLCVPEHAVVRDGMETVVFVQTEPGKYERTRILTGLSAGGYVQVTGGLFAIDAVVTQGQRQLASLFVQGVLRPSPQARKNTGLRVEPVGRQPITPVLELEAVLEVPRQNESMVSSPLPGRVAEILVAEPGEVAQGDRLATITSLDFQNLQLELIQADLAVRLYAGTFEAYRQADPSGKGLIPGQLVTEARLNREIAQARLDGLTRRLLDVGLTPTEVESIRRNQRVSDRLVIRAPRRGYAIPRDITLGRVVALGSTLFDIQDRSRMWVRARVPEQDVLAVQPGQPARLRLAAEPAFAAYTQVARLGSLPEGESRVRSVWAELELGHQLNAARGLALRADQPSAPGGYLADGMLGRLTVQAAPGVELLSVPLSAVTRDGSRTGVFVYDDKADRFTLRAVELGRRDDRHVEVLNGLKPGELVAVSAVADLRRGHGRIK